jgi:hypothetical protein
METKMIGSIEYVDREKNSWFISQYKKKKKKKKGYNPYNSGMAKNSGIVAEEFRGCENDE